MSVEKDSLMLVSLMDVADNLLDQAKINQGAADKVLAENLKATQMIYKASTQYSELVNSLPNQVKRTVTENLTGAADIAAELLASRFTEADKQAVLAAKRYEKACQHLGWKAIAIIVSASAVAIWIAIFATWYTSAQTTSLLRDKAVLAAVTRAMATNGNRVTIELCGKREDPYLCTHVNKKGKPELQQLVGISLDQYRR